MPFLLIGFCPFRSADEFGEIFVAVLEINQDFVTLQRFPGELYTLTKRFVPAEYWAL